MAHLRDPRIDLTAGQLAPLTRLRPLRHLDLQFLCADQVIAGDPEPARGDLLDRAVLRVAVFVPPAVSLRVLAALAGVALAADAIHADRQCLVRFLADRA